MASIDSFHEEKEVGHVKLGTGLEDTICRGFEVIDVSIESRQ